MPENEKLGLLYNAMKEDEVFSQVVPNDVQTFVKEYSDPKTLRTLYDALSKDEVFSQVVPDSFEEAVKEYGLGKPSAVPSSGLDGGSATKGRSVELRSTLPTTLTAKDVQSQVEQAVPAGELANIDYEKIAQKMQGRNPTEVALEEANKIQDPIKRDKEIETIYKVSADYMVNDLQTKNEQLDQFSQGIKQMQNDYSAMGAEYDRLMSQGDTQSANMILDEAEKLRANTESSITQYEGLVKEFNIEQNDLAAITALLPNQVTDNQSPLSFEGKSYLEQVGTMFDMPEDQLAKGAWNTIVPSTINTLAGIFGMGSGNEVLRTPFGQAAANMEKSLLELSKNSVIPSYGKAQEQLNKSVLEDLNPYNANYLAGGVISTILGTMAAGAIGGAESIAPKLFNANLGFGGMYGWGREAGLTPQQAALVSAPVALVYGYLGDKGVEKISELVGKESFKKFVIEGVKQMGKNATPQSVGKLFVEAAKREGLNIGAGFLREAGTESLEFTGEFGMKVLSDKAFGIKEKYAKELTADAFYKGLKENALVGGVVGAGLSPIARSIANKKTLPNIAARAKTNPNVREQYVADVNSLVQSGKITNEEADQATAALDKAIEITNRIPNNVTNEQAISEAVQLIEEKEQLTAEIEGIEPAMAKPTNDRVAEIDKRLSDIAEGKIETTVQDIQQEQEGLTSVEQPTTPNETIDLTPKGETTETDIVTSPRFTTHKGEVISDEKLDIALNKVAENLIKNAKGIREEDLYASHVTEKQKEDNLNKRLIYAEEVRNGEHLNNLSIAQRVNYELTGESIPILPNTQPTQQPTSEVSPSSIDKDLFPDELQFADVIGESGSNSQITSYTEVNGIGIAEYSNPENGLVDVIITGTSDNDYVGYVRIYKNGKPTNRWTSKMENKSGNKANFKTMVTEVQKKLPKGHEYTEKTNISLDGLRVYSNNLNRGYEILVDENGKPITNNVELNNATIEGLRSARTDEETSSLYEGRRNVTREEFNKIKEQVNSLLPNTNLLYNEANGSVTIKLPVLVSTSTNTQQNEEINETNGQELLGIAQESGNENQGRQSGEQLRPEIQAEEVTINALKDVESTAKALESQSKNKPDIEFEFVNKQGYEQKVNLSDTYEFTQPEESGLKGELIKGFRNQSNTGVVPFLEVSEAYHKAKSDGSNPELVKAVEDLLTTKTQQDATKERNVEQDNQQERQGDIGQQQGGQENRVNQEGDVAQGENIPSGGNIVKQSGAQQEVSPTIANIASQLQAAIKEEVSTGEGSPLAKLSELGKQLNDEIKKEYKPEEWSRGAKKIVSILDSAIDGLEKDTNTYLTIPFLKQAVLKALKVFRDGLAAGSLTIDAFQSAYNDAIKSLSESTEYTNASEVERQAMADMFQKYTDDVRSEISNKGGIRRSKFVADLQSALKQSGAPKRLIERLDPNYKTKSQEEAKEDANDLINLIGEQEAVALANSRTINLDTAVYIIAKNYANAKKAYDANQSPETEATLEQAFTDFDNIAKQVGRGTSMFQKVRQDFPEIFVEEFIASVDKSLDRAMGTNPNNPNSDMKPASEVAKQVPKVKEDVWTYLARVVGGDVLPKDIGKYQRKANSAFRFLVSFGVKLDAKTRDGLSQMLAKLATDGQLANAKNKEEVAKLVKDNLVDMNSRLGGVFTNAQMDEMIDGFVYLYEQIAQKKISQLIDAAFRNNKKSISGVTNSKIAKELLYGVLTDAETRRKFAAKYGLPTLNQTQVDNLNRLAANVANSKGGAKATANNALNNYITSLKRQASVNPLVRISDKFESFTAYFINNILVYPATIATAFASNTSRTFLIAIDDILSGRGNNVKKAFDTKVEIEFPDGKKQLLQRTKDAILSTVLGVSKLSEYRIQGISKQEQNIRETKTRFKRNLKRVFLTSSNRILAATDASVTSIASYLTKRQMYEELVKQAYIKQGLEVPNKETLQNDVDAIVGVDNSTLVSISQQAINDVLNGTFYQSLVADGRIDPNAAFPDASSRTKILTPEAEVFNEYMVRMYELMDDGVNDRLLDLQARRGWDEVTDITEQQMEVEKFIARRTNEITFYGRPAGTFGTLADAIVSISGKMPVLKYIGYMPLFVNASMNGVALIVKMTPALNVAQLIKYKATGRRGFGKKEFESEYIVKVDQKNMLKSVIASNAFAVVLYAYLSDLYDDKEDEIKAWKEGSWTGICTNLTQGQKALGRDATGQPYEEGWIYNNGHRVFNFRQSPFYGFFEGVGYAKNSKVFTEKWNDDKLFVEDDPEFKEAVGGYILNAAYTLTDASALRDFSSMFYTLFGKQKQDMASSFDERAAKDLERRAAGFIKNLIPLGRLQQGIKDAVDSFNGDEKLMATTFAEKLALNTLLEDYYVKSNYTDPFGRPLKERLDMGGMTVGFNAFEIVDGKFVSPADRLYSGDEYMSLYIDRNYSPNARIEMNVPITVDYDTFLQDEGEDAEEFDIAGLLNQFKEQGIETSVKEGDRKGEIKSFTYTYKLDEQQRANVNERMGGMVMQFVKQTGNMDVLKGNEELPITDTKFKSVMNSVYAISKRILIYEKFKKELGEPYRMATYKALESLAASLADDNIIIPDNWKDMLEAQ